MYSKKFSEKSKISKDLLLEKMLINFKSMLFIV